MRMHPLFRAGGLVIGLALLADLPARAEPGPSASSPLPRFTEEREAAALFFVKKHLPDLVPLLEQLKKDNPARYEREVREIFQETELLADLRDEPRHYDLELKLWVAENKAYGLVAKLATPKEEERRKIRDQLQELAKELVALDLQVLELKAEELDKELVELKEEVNRARDQMDKNIKERYEGLLEQARKRKR